MNRYLIGYGRRPIAAMNWRRYNNGENQSKGIYQELKLKIIEYGWMDNHQRH